MKLCECGCGQSAPIAKTTHRKKGLVAGEPTRFIKGHHMRLHVYTEEERAARSARMKGKKRSPEHSRRISEATRGKPKRFTDDHKEVLAARCRALTGPKHYNWKGDEVSYKTLHDWVARHKPRTHRCEDCGREPVRTDWANISGEYHRDLDDFRELCRSCHKREHARLEKVA